MVHILQVQVQTGCTMNYNAYKDTHSDIAILETVGEPLSVNRLIHVRSFSADHPASKESKIFLLLHGLE